MRKFGPIVAGAIALGVGIVAATSCGAVTLNYTEIKVDYTHTAKACVADGGTVVDKNGQAFCRIPKPSPSPTASGAGAGVTTKSCTAAGGTGGKGGVQPACEANSAMGEVSTTR